MSLSDTSSYKLILIFSSQVRANSMAKWFSCVLRLYWVFFETQTQLDREFIKIPPNWWLYNIHYEDTHSHRVESSPKTANVQTIMSTSTIPRGWRHGLTPRRGTQCPIHAVLWHTPCFHVYPAREFVMPAAAMRETIARCSGKHIHKDAERWG